MIVTQLKQAILTLAITIICASQTAAATEDLRSSPEISTGHSQEMRSAIGSKFMAVTADPRATKVAYNILKSGGTAADAAIAAQLVLGLVEPQSSGLGGGAFALYYDAASQKITSYDARETAPLNIKSDHFIKNDGTPMKFWEAVLSGRSIGTPGTPMLIHELHNRHSKKDIQELTKPAINLAKNGFRISTRLEKLIQNDLGKLDKNLQSRNYFYASNGAAKESNTIIKNKEYAELLKILEINGFNHFYTAPISTNIIKTANDNHSPITQIDFDQYKVIERKPVCDFFAQHKICSMAEPSSGGLTMLQILKLIEHAPSWHNYIEASKLAFADRNFYMADPDFVQTPSINLLDNNYIKQRLKQITKDKILESPTHGTPPNWQKYLQHKNEGINVPGTTHISIVDSYGNAVSMTSTIENAFGSRIMTNGILLNNELTDFSFLPHKNNRLIANRIEGGKRPRSSMAPTIVFDNENKVKLLIGSAGGSNIIGYVTQRIIDILHHHKPLDEALSAPHLLSKGTSINTENENDPIIQSLKKHGHTIRKKEMNSGLTAILVNTNNQTLIGAADPRRIGNAMGE